MLVKNAQSGIATAVVGVILLSGCGGGGEVAADNGGESSDGESVVVHVGTAGSGEAFVHSGPLRTAMRQGFFADRGIEVEVVAFQGGSDLLRAVASGTTDIGALATFNLAGAHAQGIDNVQAFFTAGTESPFHAFANDDLGITDQSELSGKTMAISAFGSYSDYAHILINQQEGFSGDAVVEPVPLGAVPAMIGAVDEGSVASTNLPIEFGFQFKNAKDLGPIPDPGNPFSVLMATPDFLSADAEIIEAFTEAWVEGVLYQLENKDETVTMITEELGLPPEAAEQAYDTQVRTFSTTGEINIQGMAVLADALTDMGLAETPIDPQAMYTNDFAITD